MKKLKWLIVTILLCIGFQCTNVFGSSFESVSQIQFDNIYNNISNGKSQFYSFILPNSGHVKIEINGNIENLNGTIYDSSQKYLCGFSTVWNEFSQSISYVYDVDLTKGKYYLVFQNSSGKYSINLRFTDAMESFTENGNGLNNSIYSAVPISIGISYRGQIAQNDSSDVYRIDIQKSGIYTLNADANMQCVDYTLYDISGNVVWNYSSGHNFNKEIKISRNISLEIGKYYFNVSQRNFSGIYSFCFSSHSHEYDEGNIIKNPTCTECGKKVFTCKICGETYNEDIPCIQHKWNKGKVVKKPTFNSNGVYEYTCDYCHNHKKESISKLSSTSKICISNINYRINQNNTAQVIGIVKNRRISKIVIPSYIKVYDVKFNVTSITPKAFYKNTTITSVYIGSNIEFIGDYAFYNMQRLKYIKVTGTRLKSVGRYAFYPNNTSKIYIPKSKYSTYKRLINKSRIGKNQKYVRF